MTKKEPGRKKYRDFSGMPADVLREFADKWAELGRKARLVASARRSKTS